MQSKTMSIMKSLFNLLSSKISFTRYAVAPGNLDEFLTEVPKARDYASMVALMGKGGVSAADIAEFARQHRDFERSHPRTVIVYRVDGE
ncbi:hypothetical protein [Zavarzinella formosa]|uniref:hypothetical protein n=1 Tax=Zavarzinella formosa TaxID=360055 RepID=UPI000381C89B|nr:hypothetical protein [Zavarzinella formosa]